MSSHAHTAAAKAGVAARAVGPTWAALKLQPTASLQTLLVATLAAPTPWLTPTWLRAARQQFMLQLLGEEAYLAGVAPTLRAAAGMSLRLTFPWLAPLFPEPAGVEQQLAQAYAVQVHRFLLPLAAAQLPVDRGTLDLLARHLPRYVAAGLAAWPRDRHDLADFVRLPRPATDLGVAIDYFVISAGWGVARRRRVFAGNVYILQTRGPVYLAARLYRHLRVRLVQARPVMLRGLHDAQLDLRMIPFGARHLLQSIDAQLAPAAMYAGRAEAALLRLLSTPLPAPFAELLGMPVVASVAWATLPPYLGVLRMATAHRPGGMTQFTVTLLAGVYASLRPARELRAYLLSLVLDGVVETLSAARAPFHYADERMVTLYRLQVLPFTTSREAAGTALAALLAGGAHPGTARLLSGRTLAFAAYADALGLAI